MGQSNLPLAPGSAHVKAFERAGWRCAKKRAKDANFVLSKDGMMGRLSIPAHKEVKRARLHAQIKLAGLTDEEYLSLFDE